MNKDLQYNLFSNLQIMYFFIVSMQVLLVALISPWKGTQSIVFTYLNQLPVTVVQRAESGLLQLEADYVLVWGR